MNKNKVISLNMNLNKKIIMKKNEENAYEEDD